MMKLDKINIANIALTHKDKDKKKKIMLYRLEAIVVRCGIELACSMGLPCVIFKSDCLPIIQALGRTSSDNSDLSLIIADCRTGVGQLLEHRCGYIRREANLLAHHVAKIQLADGVLSSFLWLFLLSLLDTKKMI